MDADIGAEVTGTAPEAADAVEEALLTRSRSSLNSLMCRTAPASLDPVLRTKCGKKIAPKTETPKYTTPAEDAKRYEAARKKTQDEKAKEAERKKKELEDKANADKKKADERRREEERERQRKADELKQQKEADERKRQREADDERKRQQEAGERKRQQEADERKGQQEADERRRQEQARRDADKKAEAPKSGGNESALPLLVRTLKAAGMKGEEAIVEEFKRQAHCMVLKAGTDETCRDMKDMMKSQPCQWVEKAFCQNKDGCKRQYIGGFTELAKIVMGCITEKAGGRLPAEDCAGTNEKNKDLKLVDICVIEDER